MAEVTDWDWLKEHYREDVSVVDAEIFSEKVFDFMRLGQLTEQAAREAGLRILRSKSPAC